MMELRISNKHVDILRKLVTYDIKSTLDAIDLAERNNTSVASLEDYLQDLSEIEDLLG